MRVSVAPTMGSMTNYDRDRKVLLVDDHHRSLKNIACFLRAEGFGVDEASNGNEAAQLLQKSGFDLVVSDLCMPGIDGVRLLECARSLNPNIPVVLMSGRDNVDLDRFNKRGPTAFVEKPIDLEELLSKMKSALQHREPDASATKERHD
jgi:DNA-binding NtrC family response regulator